MQSYASAKEVMTAINTLAFINPTVLPENVANILLDIAGGGVGVLTIVNAAEALYAYREDLDNEVLGIAAGIIAFATENGWCGLAVNDRGTRMVAAVRRAAGEQAASGAWPLPETDPEPAPEFSTNSTPPPLIDPLVIATP